MSKSHIYVVEKEKKNKERGYTKHNDVQYGTANYIQCELCCCFHFCCCRRHHRCRWCLLLLLHKGINNFDSMVKINVYSIWRLYSPHCVHIFNFIWLFSVAVDREEWNKRTTIMYACMQAIVYTHTHTKHCVTLHNPAKALTFRYAFVLLLFIKMTGNSVEFRHEFIRINVPWIWCSQTA